MLEGLPITLLDGISIVGVALLIGLGFATGRLYSRAQVAEIRKDHEREVERIQRDAARQIEDANHERGEWRTEARLRDQTIGELTEQNRTMLRGFETLAEFLHSLRRAGVGGVVESGDRE